MDRLAPTGICTTLLAVGVDGEGKTTRCSFTTFLLIFHLSLLFSTHSSLLTLHPCSAALLERTCSRALIPSPVNMSNLPQDVGETRLGPFFFTFRPTSDGDAVTIPGILVPLQWPPGSTNPGPSFDPSAAPYSAFVYTEFSAAPVQPVWSVGDGVVANWIPPTLPTPAPTPTPGASRTGDEEGVRAVPRTTNEQPSSNGKHTPAAVGASAPSAQASLPPRPPRRVSGQQPPLLPSPLATGSPNVSFTVTQVDEEPPSPAFQRPSSALSIL